MARRKKPEEKKDSPVKFTFKSQNEDPPMDLNFLTGAMTSTLQKSVKAQVVKKDLSKKYSGSKIVFDAHEYSHTLNGVELKGYDRLSDTDLRTWAQTDPYISAMISTRCSQASIIGRRSESKFDKGTRISELHPLSLDDFDSKEEFKKAQRIRKTQLETILNWALNCGTDDKDVINAAFADADDRTFKFCTFAEFLTAQIRNLMVFGRCGTYIIRNEEGLPVAFRPVAIETIYNGVYQRSISQMVSDETAAESKKDIAIYNSLPEEERPAYYKQQVDGQDVNFFTEYDLKISYFQKQAYWDLRGYPLAPIEQAIFMVFIHQQTLQYLKNQFLKGLATKGILNIESTEATAQLTEEDLAVLRKEFHNFVNRNDNSAAVPVISGPVRVNFIPLNPSPQDMGFLQIEEHVIRALCSAFQISPQEMGYGHLSSNQGGLTQANKEEEITQGEERGLRILLDIVYDLVNEIIFENFPQAKEICRLSYTGVGSDTKEATIARHAQELQTTGTLSSMWSDSEKTDPVPFGGDVPLSPTFHQSVARYMKYGELREHFFGEEGASKKPEYDFILDPNLNSAFQALRAQPIEMQQAQSEMSLEQMQMQMKQGEQQMAMEQEQAQMAQQQPQEAPPEAAQKSEDEEDSLPLSHAWEERQKLRKSMRSYFKEWVDFNLEEDE